MTIEYYKNNKVSYKVSYKEVALIFQIGEKTIQRWIKRFDDEQSLDRKNYESRFIQNNAKSSKYTEKKSSRRRKMKNYKFFILPNSVFLIRYFIIFR